MASCPATRFRAALCVPRSGGVEQAADQEADRGGARTPAHLAESVRALGLPLSHADLAEISHIMAAAVPVGGPFPEGMT